MTLSSSDIAAQRNTGGKQFRTASNILWVPPLFVSIRPVRGDELVCSQLPSRTFGEAVARLHGRRALKGGVQAWNIPGSANLGCPIWTPRLCWLQGFPDPFQTFEDF